MTATPPKETIVSDFLWSAVTALTLTTAFIALVLALAGPDWLIGDGRG